MSDHTPRYLAYSRSNTLTPEQQRAADFTQDKKTGEWYFSALPFVRWLSVKRGEFLAAFPHWVGREDGAEFRAAFTLYLAEGVA